MKATDIICKTIVGWFLLLALSTVGLIQFALAEAGSCSFSGEQLDEISAKRVIKSCEKAVIRQSDDLNARLALLVLYQKTYMTELYEEQLDILKSQVTLKDILFCRIGEKADEIGSKKMALDYFIECYKKNPSKRSVLQDIHRLKTEIAIELEADKELRQLLNAEQDNENKNSAIEVTSATTEPQQQQPVAAQHIGRRIAIVIGIDEYQNVPKLKKAVNDSEAVSAALQKIGYDVVSVENPDRRTMSSKLQEFQGKIQPGDTAFFFFAGHGVALGPDNILLAADVPELEPGQDDIAKDEGFSVDNIIRRFQKQGAKTAMLVLDACRNNPFENDGTRSVGSTRGLAKQDAPEGVFVMFSAGLGQEALDRLSDEDPDPNSVFTRKLVPALMTPSITHNILVD